MIEWVTEQPCCRVADLYSYIEWGWCWWTRNRLTLKILWLLECSYWHCWHSYSRTWGNVLSIEKPPRNFGERRSGDSIKVFFRGQPLVGGCSFPINNIAYWTAMFKENLTVDIAYLVPALHKIRPIIRCEDKWSMRENTLKMPVFTAFSVIVC